MSGQRRQARSDAAEARSNKREEILGQLIQETMQALDACPAVHRIGEPHLPRWDDVARIVDDVNRIVTAGYDHQFLTYENTAYHLGQRYSDLEQRLHALAMLELRFTNPKLRRGKKLEIEAERAVHAILKAIPSLVGWLDEDLAAAFRNDPAAKSLELILSAYPGVKAVLGYRLAHQVHLHGLPFIARMMSEYIHALTGIDIHPGAVIGSRFFIDHGTGTVIGETSVIGNDVSMYQGVTIGARKFARDDHGNVRHDSIKRHPTIGNGVVIYANATILGGDTVIGDYAVIGASTWITQSIAPHMIVTIDEPKQIIAENRSHPRPAVQLPPARVRTDEEWFELYYENISVSFDT